MPQAMLFVLVLRAYGFSTDHIAKKRPEFFIRDGRPIPFATTTILGVQSEVELEHVHPRLAQQAEGAPFDPAFNQFTHPRFRQTASLCTRGTWK